MQLGEKIRMLRRQKGMSQLELAEASGLYQKNISRYEQDTSQPSAQSIKKVADALGTTIDYLMNDDVEETTIKDPELLKKFEEIQQLSSESRKVVNYLLDLVIRDAQTKKTYGLSA